MSKTAKKHKFGTAPDTSLHLGQERRVWLKTHGGIQPTIRAMIDRAMRRRSSGSDLAALGTKAEKGEK